MYIDELANALCKLINDKFDTLSRKKLDLASDIKNFADKINLIIQHYFSSPSDVALARILISLDKVIDYYSLDVFTKKEQKDVLKLVRSIVKLSTNILSPKNKKFRKTPRCGRHEDKACTNSKPSIGHFQHIKKLPPYVAINFINNTLTHGEMLTSYNNIIRIIGKNNSPFGSYWLINKKPNSKKNWRSQYAVLSAWNDGTYYVELKTTEKFDYWIGQAASQGVPFEKCILRGGYIQIWIPPKTMKKLKKYITTTPIPTRW